MFEKQRDTIFLIHFGVRRIDLSGVGNCLVSIYQSVSLLEIDLWRWTLVFVVAVYSFDSAVDDTEFYTKHRTDGCF